MKRIYQLTIPQSYDIVGSPPSDLEDTNYYERPTKLRKLSSAISTDDEAPHTSSVDLDLSGSCNLKPKLLSELSSLLPNLRSLNLSCCNYLTDEDIFILFSRTNTTPSTYSLERVDLSHTQITDESIKLIALKCPQLSSLNLKGCLHITDISLSLVAQYCKDLSHLIVADCGQISDISIQLVAQETKHRLVLLDLNECTRITDKSLGYLGYYCPNLSYLRLKNTSVTSAVLAKLLPRVRLSELNVQGVAGIDDSFLFLLSRFQQANLKCLDVSFCYRVSSEGVDKVVSEADLLCEVSLFGLSIPHLEVLRLQRLHPLISFFV